MFNSTSFARRALNVLPRAAPAATRSQSTFAKMTVVGRLTATPEVATTSGGDDVVTFSIATSFGFYEQQRSSFWRFAQFIGKGEQAEKAKERFGQFTKGSLLHVEGDASYRKFTTKDGREELALSLLARRIDVLQKKPDEDAAPAAASGSQ